MAHSLETAVRAELIGTFIEILAYGVYFVVFCKCLQVLHVKYTEGRPTAVLACTALLIFVLVTIHFIMDILRCLNAFTTHLDIPNYAAVYYTIVRRDLDLVKSGAYIAMTIVSDSLIGYRTYIVWARSMFLAVFLALLIVADVALGTYAVYLLAATRPGDDALSGRVTERVKWFYVVTLVVNLLCTVLIALKIWRVQHEVDRYSPAVSALRNGGSSKNGGRGGLFRVRNWMPGDRLILVVVESAAIYSLLLIIMIVMSVLGAPAMLAMLNLIAPIIGIVFSMIIIRVSIDRTRWESLKISTHLNFVMSSASQSRPRSRNRLRRTSQNKDAQHVAPSDDTKASMPDVQCSIAMPGLGFHTSKDDSTLDQSSGTITTSEKMTLPSIAFNMNSDAPGSSMEDLATTMGHVTVASYAYPNFSRRGSDAGVEGLGVGYSGEVGSMFSVSAGGRSLPESFVCAI
ncbi:hypothetical protein BDW22DRAFT_1364141 [Trametopsis cervina]|nr:hypothetical protein BDW22DRAFT_1364141 [Trametopsis cervina]